MVRPFRTQHVIPSQVRFIILFLLFVFSSSKKSKSYKKRNIIMTHEWSDHRRYTSFCRELFQGSSRNLDLKDHVFRVQYSAWKTDARFEAGIQIIIWIWCLKSWDCSSLKCMKSLGFIQGYVIYSVRKKLKKQYIHLKGKQIEKLKKSGVEVCNFCNIVLVENFSYWMLILACIFN